MGKFSLSSIVILNSLFGQFDNDSLFLVPISFLVVVLILFCFVGITTPTFHPLVRGRLFAFRSSVQSFFIGFIFPDRASEIRGWILPLYSLNTMLISVNLVGLIPYTYSLTSHVSFTYGLAFPFWASMQFIGFFYYFNHRVSHFLPSGTPWSLVPFMVIIEFVGLFIQPVALGLRLAANMTAGHILIHLFCVSVWTLMSLSVIVSLTSFVVLVLLFVLEVGVSLIQAYVFVSLLSFFHSQNVEH
uniref:ATP synthase subunit a n=1 Tax=Protankyra bidentata TaxID=2904677 RepID=A0AAU7E540_9ECHN